MVNGYLPTSFWLNWVFRNPLGKIVIFKISNWVLHVFVLGIVIEDENKVKIKNKGYLDQLISYNIGSGT